MLVDAAGNCPEMCRIPRIAVRGAVRELDFPGNGTRDWMSDDLRKRDYGAVTILIVLNRQYNTIWDRLVNDKNTFRGGGQVLEV